MAVIGGSVDHVIHSKFNAVLNAKDNAKNTNTIPIANRVSSVLLMDKLSHPPGVVKILIANPLM